MPFDPNAPYESAPAPASGGFDPNAPYESAPVAKTDATLPGTPAANAGGEKLRAEHEAAANKKGVFGKTLDYVLSQGGAFTPETGAKKLIGGAVDLASSLPFFEPMGVSAPLAAKGAVKGAEAAAKGASATARGVGNVAAELVGNLGTHTGGESLREAYRAGREGGMASEKFLASLRGEARMDEVVNSAKDALAKMREARNTAYRAGMVDVAGDATKLSFEGVDKSLQKISEIASYKGKTVNPEAATRLQEVREAVEEWRSGEPEKFHTVEGFDALKQRIGAILETTTPHTKASAAVGDAYNAVRDAITEQAPAYGKIMKDYETANSAIRDIESGLSLKNKGSVDTALRKLQSVMRNNVQTNFGGRLKMAQDLNEASGGQIMPQLAGQSLSSVTPRGLGNVMAGGSVLASLSHPAFLPTLPFQSPRVMGEVSYGLGQVARGMRNAADAAGRQARAILDSLGIP